MLLVHAGSRCVLFASTKVFSFSSRCLLSTQSLLSVSLGVPVRRRRISRVSVYVFGRAHQVGAVYNIHVGADSCMLHCPTTSPPHGQRLVRCVLLDPGPVVRALGLGPGVSAQERTTPLSRSHPIGK